MKKLIYLNLILLLIGCSKNENEKTSLINENFIKLSSNTTQTITDIDFYDENNGVICGNIGLLSKTTDEGSTWSSLNASVTPTFLCAEIIDPSTIYTARIGIYGSKNQGQNFNEIGNFSTYGSSIFGFHFFDANSGIILKNDRVYKTIDGGNNWEIKYEGSFLTKIQFTSTKVGYIYGGYSNSGIAGGAILSSGKMYKSIDSGNNWIDLNLNTSAILTAYFLNDNLGYYSNFNHEIFKTIDGGINWIKINDSTSSTITSIVFIDENNGYLTNLNGEILMTKNGGKTWTVAYNQTTSQLIKIIKTKNCLYAVGDDGLILKKKL